ncbi:hypothetical protein LRR18_18425, partial [Mangrovimonas sp. AS39]|uniref:hypothetical protein n=1 Tax=Mangrovimonas futianensis TaxID=2895523 RepID=UPI001E636497
CFTITQRVSPVVADSLCAVIKNHRHVIGAFGEIFKGNIWSRNIVYGGEEFVPDFIARINGRRSQRFDQPVNVPYRPERRLHNRCNSGNLIA